MTPLDQSIGLLHTAANALVLWFVWHFPWRKSCQERYRQKLFTVRDELFDFARRGSIAFTDPAYIALRAYINSMIRFSHLIGVTRLATFILFQRYIGDVPQHYPALGSAISQVKGREAKEFLIAIREQVADHTIRHLLFSSPHILIASPLLRLLDHLIAKRATPVSTSKQRNNPVVTIIEIQARDAYKSEAVKRSHDAELASVPS